MPFEFTAHKGRTSDHTITLKDPAGTTVVLGSGDQIRIKIGRNAGTPSIDLKSGTASANNSSCTAANPTTLRLAQADLAELDAGVYDVEILLVDNSETLPDNAIKLADQGTMHLMPTLAGPVTI